MPDVIGPDFYREIASSDTAEAARAHDLIDTNDPAFGQIMRACLELSTTYGFDITDPDVVKRAILAGQRRHRYAVDQQRLQAEAQAARVEVVYYMRLGNRVKIGYTADLDGRRALIQPEEVLVTEVGGREREAQRHRQFAGLRVVGEWFSYEGALVAHVEDLRAYSGGAL